MPGLLYMPDPLSRPAGTVAAEASWFAPWGRLDTSAFGLSAALSLGGMASLALHAAAETASGNSSAADLAISALVGIFGDRASILGGAFFLRQNLRVN